jgi:hypothetical protein
MNLAAGLPSTIVLWAVIYFVSQKLVNYWGAAQKRSAGY